MDNKPSSSPHIRILIPNSPALDNSPALASNTNSSTTTTTAIPESSGSVSTSGRPPLQSLEDEAGLSSNTNSLRERKIGRTLSSNGSINGNLLDNVIIDHYADNAASNGVNEGDIVIEGWLQKKSDINNQWKKVLLLLLVLLVVIGSAPR